MPISNQKYFETARLHRTATRLLAGLLLAAAQLVVHAESLSFDAAIERMKASNEAVQATGDDTRQREEEQEAAKGLRLPRVEMEARETILDSPIKLGIAPTSLAYRIQGAHFLAGDVTATLPLYAGGRITAANRAAAARVREALASGETTQDQLVTELARRYFGLCLAQRNRAVQALKADAMRVHAYQARRRTEEGMAAKVEHLNAQVALSDAQTELDAADRDVTIVAEGVVNIVATTERIEPATALFVVGDLEPVEQFQDYVNDEHPILKTVSAKKELADQGVTVEEAEEKPTIYLFGKRALFDQDLTILDPKWAAGIGLSYTLFDGSQARHKVAAAKAVRDKVARLHTKAQRDLRSLVLQRYNELQKARRQYDGYATTLALANENLRVRTRAFQEGLATSVEVVDATLSLARARLGRLKSAYDQDVALFGLLEASGRSGRYQDYLSRSAPVPEEETVKTPQSPSTREDAP